MKAWTLIIVFFALNASGMIVSYLVTAGVLVGSSETMPYSMDDFHTYFDITNFSAAGLGSSLLYGGLAGGIIGLIGLYTKQGVFAIIAVLIFVVGLFFNIFKWMIAGFPMMINVLLKGTGLDFIGYIVEAFFLIVFFMELAGILAQREMTRTD